jgi:hypothetical protein
MAVITLGDMFRELDSFIPCEEHFAAADASGITTKNNAELKTEVRLWGNGTYDEDPHYLVNILISILKRSKK